MQSSARIGKWMTVTTLGVVACASQALASPVLVEPTTELVAPVAATDLDAELAGMSVLPSDWKQLTETTAPSVDAIGSPQAELPPVIPLPPAVIPGLVTLAVVLRATRRRLARPVAR